MVRALACAGSKAAISDFDARLLSTDNPAECSGPPHLLGPWGSAGLDDASGLLITSLLAGHLLQPAIIAIFTLPLYDGGNKKAPVAAPFPLPRVAATT
jgi:hypothetical protein